MRKLLFTLIVLSTVPLLVADTEVFSVLDSRPFGGGAQLVGTAPGRVTDLGGGLAFPQWLFAPPSPGVVVLNLFAPFDALQQTSHTNVGVYPPEIPPILTKEAGVLGFGCHPLDLNCANGALVSMLVHNVGPDTIACIGEGGCSVWEDGSVYTWGYIRWSNGDLDILQFQSTPEPTSLVLLGIVVVVSFTLKRRFALSVR